MQYKRSNRVAELLKREISRILVEEIKDPGINFVNITNVKISDDLRSSKIYFTVIGDKSVREKTKEGLDRATTFIRCEIGKRLKLRYIPELRFYYDAVADHVENIENLFLKIKQEDTNY